MTLKICIAQLNFCVGDMPGNAQKIIDAVRTAYDGGARLVLTPELARIMVDSDKLELEAEGHHYIDTPKF